MKKMIVCALLASLVLSCTACKESVNQQVNQGGSVEQGSSEIQGGESAEGNDSLGEGTGNDDNTSEGEGQRVTYGKLEEDEVVGIYYATDKCFLYAAEAFRSYKYGIADYEGNVLAKAEYINADLVEDSIILWKSGQMVVYNFDGELVHTVNTSEEYEPFDVSTKVSDLYYCLEKLTKESEAGEHMDEYETIMCTYDGQQVCSFNGILRTFPNEDGFFLATTNRSTTNAVIDMQGNELKFTTSDGIGVESFEIHQQSDVYGGAFLFGTKYASFDEIVLENGEEMSGYGIIDVSTKTITLLDKSVRLYDYNNDCVLAVVKDDAGNEKYGLYFDGFGKLILDLSSHEVVSEYGLHDAKFFSREKGYILLTLKGNYYAIIDMNGNVIVDATEGYVPFNGDSNYLSDNGLYPFANAEDKKGVADLEGNIIIPCGQYESMSRMIKGHAVVNGTSVIDVDGNVLYSIPE